jgi:hypothetical protein
MTQRKTNPKTIPCAQCHKSIKIGEWCVKDTADFGIELGRLESDFYGFTVPDYDPTFDGYSNDETLLIHVNCTPAYLRDVIANEELVSQFTVMRRARRESAKVCCSAAGKSKRSGPRHLKPQSIR